MWLSVQVYEPSGSYSIIIEKAELDGVKAQTSLNNSRRNDRIACLKNASSKFFHESRGNHRSGAVIRDIIRPSAGVFLVLIILLYPTKVQGDGAEENCSRNASINVRHRCSVGVPSRTSGPLTKKLWHLFWISFASWFLKVGRMGPWQDADRRAATPPQLRSNTCTKLDG